MQRREFNKTALAAAAAIATQPGKREAAAATRPINAAAMARDKQKAATYALLFLTTFWTFERELPIDRRNWSLLRFRLCVPRHELKRTVQFRHLSKWMAHCCPFRLAIEGSSGISS